MRHKSNNKTRPLFTLSLEMTRLVNETRLLLVPCFNLDIYGKYNRSVSWEPIIPLQPIILTFCEPKLLHSSCKTTTRL